MVDQRLHGSVPKLIKHFMLKIIRTHEHPMDNSMITTSAACPDHCVSSLKGAKHYHHVHNEKISLVVLGLKQEGHYGLSLAWIVGKRVVVPLMAVPCTRAHEKYF